MVTKNEETVLARLTLVVEYKTEVSKEDVEEIIDSARALGTIKKATLEYLKPYTLEF